MSADLLSSVFSNLWTFFFALVLLGLSIFVHELGHFLAARRRGVHVERFSIGFGPAIWSRRGRDGVEYRLSWFPLGGYVLLPQLADLGPIEGKSELEVERLPVIGYGSKMIVFVAGAAFNVLFAFVLATLLWVIGLPESNVFATTRIGHVAPTLELADGSKVPAPAMEAGLKAGDYIRTIDGHVVKDWNEVRFSLTLGDGRSLTGERQVVIGIERDGRPLTFTLHPRLAGQEKERRIGVAPGYELLVSRVAEKSVGEQAGFKKGDEILSFDDTPLLSELTYSEYLDANLAKTVTAHVRRNGQELALTIPPTPNAKPGTRLGLVLTTGFRITHPSPFVTIADQAKLTFRSLWSFLSPRSDVGLDKASGVVGLIRVFQSATEAGLRAVLIITILVNVNLAIFNLLPIPVLDGGQMVFATIARIRSRALPVNFVVATQSICLALLISLIVYVAFSDSRRWINDVRAESSANGKP